MKSDCSIVVHSLHQRFYRHNPHCHSLDSGSEAMAAPTSLFRCLNVCEDALSQDLVLSDILILILISPCDTTRPSHWHRSSDSKYHAAYSLSYSNAEKCSSGQCFNQKQKISIYGSAICFRFQSSQSHQICFPAPS